MKIVAAIALVLFALPASAGNRVGNGGDVVICPEKSTLLDFYERPPVAAAGAKDYQAILAQRIAALAKAAPKLAEQYGRRAKSIGNEIDFKADVKLTDVKDSLHAFEPDDDNCKVRQIAIRQNQPVGKRFLIDDRSWKALDAQNKAGLILHEIIYEHLAKLGQTDSRKVRKLNAHIFSSAIETEGSGKFWLMIKDLEIPLYP